MKAGGEGTGSPHHSRNSGESLGRKKQTQPEWHLGGVGHGEYQPQPRGTLASPQRPGAAEVAKVKENSPLSGGGS